MARYLSLPRCAHTPIGVDNASPPPKHPLSPPLRYHVDGFKQQTLALGKQQNSKTSKHHIKTCHRPIYQPARLHSAGPALDIRKQIPATQSPWLRHGIGIAGGTCGKDQVARGRAKEKTVKEGSQRKVGTQRAKRQGCMCMCMCMCLCLCMGCPRQ